MTTSIYLMFLIWNLFLAVIPFLLTSYLKTRNLFENKFKNGIIVIIWLLFLPNSFYIITDFVHLSLSNSYTFWYDLLLISSYSTLGFLLGIISLQDFEKSLSSKFSSLITSILLFSISILSGFGIYLGRILRYNSWDILKNPIDLFTDLLNIFFTTKSLGFSILFGCFIYFIFRVSKHFTITINQ
ncbi:DUF1361 domain-containing protein [uncultured Flavobacterium sp.]|uniref:DUF1361 domain-containing protein n=1 Tax=uncultured Flavobacterium sp. TaxID=165435 RepID=UPI0030ED8FCD